MCTPPVAVREERARRGLPPLKPKVIFKSLADAEAYAGRLVVAGKDPQRAYLCPFSSHGHAHLTNDIAGQEVADD